MEIRGIALFDYHRQSEQATIGKCGRYMNGWRSLPESMGLFRFEEFADETRSGHGYRGSEYVGSIAVWSCREGAPNLDESMNEGAKTESVAE